MELAWGLIFGFGVYLLVRQLDRFWFGRRDPYAEEDRLRGQHERR